MDSYEIDAFSLPSGSANFSGDRLCLHLLRSGSASILRGNHYHRIAEDAYLLQNVGTSHTVLSEGSQVVTFCLPPELVRDEQFAECATPHDFYVNRAISHLVGALRHGGASARTHWGQEVVRSLLEARDKSKEKFFLKEPHRQGARCEEMKKAREYVLARLDQPLSVPDVARHCGLSPYHFHRLFSEWHGLTPGQYIVKEKIRRACRKLVLTNDGVTSIAAACGFFSSTSFAGTFKANTGFTPGAFRKMAAKHRTDLSFFMA